MTVRAIFGEHEEHTLEQLYDVASRAEHAALMADGHLGYIMPIGGVAAYRNKVSVAGVGFDIACGNCAIQTDKRLTDEGMGMGSPVWRQIADEIAATLSFGIGRKNLSIDAPVDHPLFESDAWKAVPGAQREPLREKARSQLGTIGSGNHYVDVFTDENDIIWVGVHFGSRGFGHTVASGFMALHQGKQWGARVPETEALLGLDSGLGQQYFALMNLAGDYAYAGREWVARLVVNDILRANEVELVHNHHNFAWLEEHFGEQYVVVRKGATPAFPGQRGFVGGSMGDDAVILQGSTANNEHQRNALYSTVHGAGRVMSRTQAAGSRPKVNRKTGERTQRRKGLITRQMMSAWTKEKGVIVRGGGVDESPHVYRRLSEVLAAQGDTIEILHTLRPLVVVMAGADEFDPYKD
jgi:tRNA-splicing ligase RtcB (3'-phosphate/5'-hydroxy nucleic acid ligase)